MTNVGRKSGSRSRSRSPSTRGRTEVRPPTTTSKHGVGHTGTEESTSRGHMLDCGLTSSPRNMSPADMSRNSNDSHQTPSSSKPQPRREPNVSGSSLSAAGGDTKGGQKKWLSNISRMGKPSSDRVAPVTQTVRAPASTGKPQQQGTGTTGSNNFLPLL